MRFVMSRFEMQFTVCVIVADMQGSLKPRSSRLTSCVLYFKLCLMSKLLLMITHVWAFKCNWREPETAILCPFSSWRPSYSYHPAPKKRDIEGGV